MVSVLGNTSTFTATTTAAVPEPTSLLLLGSACSSLLRFAAAALGRRPSSPSRACRRCVFWRVVARTAGECSHDSWLRSVRELLRSRRPQLASDNMRSTNEVTRIGPRLLPSESDEDRLDQTAHVF